MSQAVIGAFFKALGEDKDLEAGCTEAVGRGAFDVVVRMAAERGFVFTAEEFKKAWEDKAALLSDEDLGKVAGGAGTAWGRI
jgi:predicted ribosomally synthesized peptide with nif11-like leader